MVDAMNETFRWSWPSVEDPFWEQARQNRYSSTIRHAIRDALDWELSGIDLVVDAVYTANQLRAAAEIELLLLIQEARARGVAWTAIGKQFGISRQAAQKRFGNPLSPELVRELDRERAALIERAKWSINHPAHSNGRRRAEARVMLARLTEPRPWPGPRAPVARGPRTAAQGHRPQGPP
jgi:hypothetical protein